MNPFGLCHKLNNLKDIDKFYLKYYNKYTIYILKGFRAAKSYAALL